MSAAVGIDIVCLSTVICDKRHEFNTASPGLILKLLVR